MSKRTLAAALSVAVLGVSVALKANLAQSASPTAAPAAAPKKAAAPAMAAAHAAPAPIPAATALINEYCLECHDKWDAKGSLVLDDFDASHPERNAEVAEKVIRKLRAGLMPPAEAEKHPDRATVMAAVESLETQIDRAAAAHPNPGSRPFQRLTRAEYGRSIHDMLGLDVDVEAFLPPDTVSRGFDNIADVQGLSPSLMEGYLRAASRISREAMGDPRASATTVTYKVPRTSSQMIHEDGTPIGTRGGIGIVHNFPADGKYVFKLSLQPSPTGQLFGLTAKGEQIEVSINGERAALIDINPRMSEADPQGMNLYTEPIPVKAGPQRVAAAFLQRFVGPVDDLISPIEHTFADSQIGTSPGITALPHLREMAIIGPSDVTGVSDTPSRRKILICRPAAAAEERPCATRIVAALATAAYRRPVTDADVQSLMTFYDAGRKGADFDAGVTTALQAMLASPSFVFRLERLPAGAKAGQAVRLTDLELASRLSYFLWATEPDADLIKVAAAGGLKTPAGLEQQVRRMLKDPRADALSTRFAAQWLRLHDLENMAPDALLYPQYDHTLGEAMLRETELFFDSIVREDRNVLDLITADYTFVNERLARHYGIPNVAGDNFQRVALTDDHRRGLLGQGSILTLTSVADRTSPVQRGKWVLEVLLGTPPPQPPPNVPPFDNTKSVAGGRMLSVRERMEEHRKNPMCNSCHRVIDPIGLALENFDVTGKWRIKDSGVPIDSVSAMYDGSKIDGPASLRAALLKHSDIILRNFTQNLMTYALGRRVEYYDMPAVRAIVRGAGTNGNTFSSYVLGIVKSAAFQMSRVDDTAPASRER